MFENAVYFARRCLVAQTYQLANGTRTAGRTDLKVPWILPTFFGCTLASRQSPKAVSPRPPTARADTFKEPEGPIKGVTFSALIKQFGPVTVLGLERQRHVKSGRGAAPAGIQALGITNPVCHDEVCRN